MFSFTMSKAINTGTDHAYRTFGKALAWKWELMAWMVKCGYNLSRVRERSLNLTRANEKDSFWAWG